MSKKEEKKHWTVEATNFDDETEIVLENFFGTYNEAQKEVDKNIDEIEKQIDFINQITYYA
jgi:hypothetical protein